MPFLHTPWDRFSDPIPRSPLDWRRVSSTLIPSLALTHYTPSSTRDQGYSLKPSPPSASLLSTISQITGNMTVRLVMSLSIERVTSEYIISVLHHYPGATPTCATAIETVP